MFTHKLERAHGL